MNEEIEDWVEISIDGKVFGWFSKQHWEQTKKDYEKWRKEMDNRFFFGYNKEDTNEED